VITSATLFSSFTMPRVLSYTPSWLSRPSAGFDIFATKNEAHVNGSSKPSKHADFSVPPKTIACRGTEVFVAVGNEIRWSDLTWLKELEEDEAKGGEFTSEKQGYRVRARCPKCIYYADVVRSSKPIFTERSNSLPSLHTKTS
jgi:hypothetical protein